MPGALGRDKQVCISALGNRAYLALKDIVVRYKDTGLAIAYERLPVTQRVAKGETKRCLWQEHRVMAIEPAPEIGEYRHRFALANLELYIRRMILDSGFDFVEFGDPSDRLSG